MTDTIKLTKKEAILRHRELWNWIATESLRQKRAVSKKEAFEHFGWAPCECDCWSCEYDKENTDVRCSKCPVVWPEGDCTSQNSPFRKWRREKDYRAYARYAKVIAELPERGQQTDDRP